MKLLQLAKDLVLPVDVATQTFLVVGKRGSGKTSTCVRLAEQFYAQSVPFVVIDPADVWHGLKAAGTGPGLGVYVFGGSRADLPLEPTAGALLAETIVEHRLSAVLSVRHFSVRERGRFVAEFCQRLFQRNSLPLHLFLEESHEVAPQQPFKGEEEMLGHVTRIWKLGRSCGIGGSAITQRPASLSKNITTQAEILIVHRTIGPQDVAAIREWIKYHGEREDILAQLSTLQTGEAFVWAPDFPEHKPIGLVRVRMLPRTTFDSSATPKAGEVRKEPKAVASVDLDLLREQMAATIERAKADDPKALRERIAQLERQLATKPKAEPVEVRVDVLTADDRRLLKDIQHVVDALLEEVRFSAELVKSLNQLAPALARVAAPAEGVPSLTAGRRGMPTPTVVVPVNAGAIKRPETGGEKPDGLRRMLIALAQRPTGLTTKQLGIRAQLAAGSGTFSKYLGRMRALELVTGRAGEVTLSAELVDG